ncbi:hypothetical protein GCM10014719_30520 [Planomonospora parontospora subsp. antibiotica]|nr:hypothetical protein GCM10014719_30520 [Planomonospora parontospora subsp. antibiotica]GII16151.1 hypothetical protein Ppa05_28770 [Planomonospora parontospora subsp. antibiotica]
MPSPSIDIGIRPTKPEITKPLTPGVLNSSRYGPTTDFPLPHAPGVDRIDDFAPNGSPASDFPRNGVLYGPLRQT